MGSENLPSVPGMSSYIYQLVGAGTGQAGCDPVCFAAQSAGLFSSHDGGRIWKPAYSSLGTTGPLTTTCVVLAPQFEHDPSVFAGLNGAILRSHDGGARWQRGRLPAPLPSVSTLTISPAYAEDGTLFAGTNEDGVLISRDRGSSWVAWNFGLLDLHILSLAISPDFARDETLFAGTDSGLFRSTNGGRAWREISLPIGFDAVLSLAVSPSFARDCTVFAGTENNGLLISSDKGKTWQLCAGTTGAAPINQILLSPRAPYRQLLLLFGDALWKSSDRGNTWKPWKPKRLAASSITAAFVLDGPRPTALIGLDDGRILRC